MIQLSHYFIETAMGVDVYAQEYETKFTTTIHRFEKSLSRNYIILLIII